MVLLLSSFLVNLSSLFSPSFFTSHGSSNFQLFGDAFVSGLFVKSAGQFLIWNALKCAEILRVSGMMSNQGFGDFDRLRHRSPSPMASSNLISNVTGTGFGSWNGLPQEVIVYLIFSISIWCPWDLFCLCVLKLCNYLWIVLHCVCHIYMI